MIILGAAFGGAVAQSGERINRTDEVRGSNPLSSTTYPNSDEQE